MKRLSWIWALLAFLSCKKSNDPASMRLERTESTHYMGDVTHTEYSYDNKDRITSIFQAQNNEPPAAVVTIHYNGNEAVLISSPDFDPAYTQNTEVRLTLDATGKLLKRIEYTHRVAITPGLQSQEFRNDTVTYEYDAAGLLTKTTGSRRDSIWVQQDYTVIRQFTSTVTYTNNGGNVTGRDEYVTYPYRTTQGGVTTISGGSSEYHQVFHYSKSFPNKTDFKNAAILNEYKQYYEPVLSSNYKNMPDRVVINNIDRDINGAIIFNGNGAVDIDRTYNDRGFLSSVNILSANTHFRKINFFYGR